MKKLSSLYHHNKGSVASLAPTVIMALTKATWEAGGGARQGWTG